jgi:hypothetical protein
MQTEYQEDQISQVWQLITIIPASWETETEGLWLEASLDKRLVRPYFKEQAHCGSVYL